MSRRSSGYSPGSQAGHAAADEPGQRADRADPNAGGVTAGADGENGTFQINYLKAAIPLVPLVLLFVRLNVYCTCPAKYLLGLPRKVSSSALPFRYPSD